MQVTARDAGFVVKLDGIAKERPKNFGRCARHQKEGHDKRDRQGPLQPQPQQHPVAVRRGIFLALTAYQLPAYYKKSNRRQKYHWPNRAEKHPSLVITKAGGGNDHVDSNPHGELKELEKLCVALEAPRYTDIVHAGDRSNTLVCAGNRTPQNTAETMRAVVTGGKRATVDAACGFKRCLSHRSRLPPSLCTAFRHFARVSEAGSSI
eukprot:7376921-Prymnesium_polylepis.5